MKLKASKETEVFVYDGYISIRQFEQDGDADVVRLTPDQAKAVCDELTRLVKDKSQWWSPISTTTDGASF